MASHRKRMPASSSDHMSGEWKTYRPIIPARSTPISANTRSAAGIAVRVKSAVFVRATHDARDGFSLCHSLLFHQKLQSAIAPAARRHFEHAGLVAICIDDGPDVQALQQGTLRDALGQLLDRNACFYAADVRLAEHELIEGNVARRGQRDFLNFRHLASPRRVARRLSLGFQPVTESLAHLSLSLGPHRSNITPPRNRQQPNPTAHLRQNRE